MEQQGKLEELTANLKRYADTNFELIKLKVAERSSIIGSGLISSLVIGLVGILFVLFISLWAGFYISAILNNSYSGFMIVAGFYLLLALILIIVKKQLLEKPLRDRIIRKLFSKK